ncbi:type I-E CRISPR-associated protein Cse2/CasB [Teredinibacter haidensis]|uniref:type I-E CRISPR-associated protein Cse2/CasB n=1 Tax=Teredinibacter haidensis TaxID=2731755 RepID=UPI0009F89208|nr:type I-E CRISPR-associated protein Cse2/CasB [Teredinibacter haidensis]
MDDHSKIVVLRWWQSMFLPATQLKEKGILAAPSAHKAQLRRCESADIAMLTEGFRALWLGLDESIVNEPNSKSIESWATIAATLVHVKNNSSVKLAVAAGRKGDGDKSVVSELRFSQLQNAKTPEDFLRRIRRIIRQIKGELDVLSLAENIHQWFEEYNQFRPRKADKRIAVKWAMDYYRAASMKAK